MNRYLRGVGTKKSLVELATVIAGTFQFIQSHAETGKVLTGCSTVRPVNQSDLQYRGGGREKTLFEVLVRAQ